MISSSQRPLPDNTQHSRQTNIHAPVGFEPTISAGERPQNYALDRAATGTGCTACPIHAICIHIIIAAIGVKRGRSVLFNDAINCYFYVDSAIIADKTITALQLWNDTYLLTPWSRVLLGKLTGLQLVKKFPAFYGTRRFITALTSARHLSLS